jgi:hypothetical protein
MTMSEVTEAKAALESGFTRKIKSSAAGQKIASVNDLQKAFDLAINNLIGKEITQVMMVERAIGLLSTENKAEIDKSLNHIEAIYRDKKAALLDKKVTEHCKTPDALLGLKRIDAARLNESRDIIHRYATMYDSNRQITLSDEAIDTYARAQRFGGREALVSQIRFYGACCRKGTEHFKQR